MRDLSSALQKLPALPGEYLRVDEYQSSEFIPWGRSIRAGDLVTAYPDFLNASSSDLYARWASDEYPARSRPHVLAFYKITSSTRGVPRFPEPDNPDSDFMVLFSRDTCFQVRGIAVAETRAAVFPPVRIGVLLEQVSDHGRPLKHLHTGQPLRIHSLL